MSSERPGEEPAIFRLPPESFRVGSGEAPAAVRPEPAARADRPAPTPQRDTGRTAPRRRRKAWDIVLTIVLLVATATVAAVASALALLLASSSTGCGADGRVCRTELLQGGVWTMLTVPWIAFVLTAFFAVLLLVVRRRAFWVPLVGTVLAALSWVVGAFLLWAAV
ncbi:DUF6264 family protein [Microbacterium sp. SORGH_AS_0862]|uniref:DUF6264 family protein n=1 Tax=Microbacterium sp. SORGH_AS_0862 TaxID=3041789 RepID=UPI002791866C|nr:DUF6264 family protein [Microbacterium sp. SORGH_AS_0862]MDQ1205795.1 lysylphosphatidylglycerol synthetase-like protein (DUF2156 family) [Microbacterium sp. SORGH_AS_0862]